MPDLEFSLYILIILGAIVATARALWYMFYQYPRRFDGAHAKSTDLAMVKANQDWPCN